MADLTHGQKKNAIVEIAAARMGTNPSTGNKEQIYRHTTKGGEEFWYPQQLAGGTVVKIQWNKKGEKIPASGTNPERTIEKDSWSCTGVMGDLQAVNNLTQIGKALKAYEELEP
jgi:hypothetical protein